MLRDQVRDRLPFVFKDQGDRYVKNIARQVRVYRVRDVGAVDKSPSTPVPPVLPLPKPSIAVLHFTNMSSDPEQEFFSDDIQRTSSLPCPGILRSSPSPAIQPAHTKAAQSM